MKEKIEQMLNLMEDIVNQSEKSFAEKAHEVAEVAYDEAQSGILSEFLSWQENIETSLETLDE